MEEAKKFKAVGNQFFSAGEYEKAIVEFTKAIELYDKDHVFFSNRSACYASLGQYDKALEDANQCVSIKPTWAKGYVRQGLALFNLNKIDEAKQAYDNGLKIDPNNSSLKEGLQAVAQKQQANPFGALFGPDMWTKLQTSPQTAPLLQDQGFVQKMKMLQQNPQMMMGMMQDPQVSMAFQVLLGLPGDAKMGQDAEMFNNDAAADGEPKKQYRYKSSNPYENFQNATNNQPKQEEPAREETADEKEDRLEREAIAREKAEIAAQAEAEKEKGNVAYKAKEFDTALKHYDAAIAINNKNPGYLNNKAAVFLAMKEYKQAVEAGVAAVAVGKREMSDTKTMAKIYLRLGNAYMKQQDYTNAVESYEAARFEETSNAIEAALKKAKRIKIKADAEAYLSPELSEKHKQLGNDLYKEGKWREAITEYTEALKRDPSNFKCLSNRANCYSKVMQWQLALDDAEAVIKVEPTFVKAYIRKAKTQHFLRQYHKAIETYQQGLEIDPNSSELREGLRETQMKIQMENMDGKIDPQRREMAMRDPEIQQILQDPQMNIVLQRMQTDPKEAQRIMRDPVMGAKIQKLINAGVLQVR